MKNIRLERWFYAFLFLHVLLWTAVPFCVRHTLPLDSMEGYVWGQQLEWGYDKNPFLNGWLTALAVNLGGDSGWMIYLFSQISVALCFFAVWQIGKKILPPAYALLGVILLEAVQYYNFHAIDFNDNTLELSLWALLTLFFYQALRTNKIRDWIGCGIFAGLSAMAKYYSVVLFLPMLCFLLLFKENYKCFKTPGLYIALGIFSLIVAPHVMWLFSHDFITVNYAFNRVSSPPTLWNHISYPSQFIYEQFQAILPALILTLLLLVGKKPLLQQPRTTLSSYDKNYLFIVGLGPLVVTALLSLFLGFKLRAGWGEPLFSFAGLLLIGIIQPRITPKKFYSFMGIFFTLMFLAVGGYGRAFILSEKPSSANFPGKAFAQQLTEEWYKQHHQPLAYVAGSRWLAGNVAFYSKDHPHVFINCDTHVSPWINEAELKENGAIFIWQKDGEVPPDLYERFKHLTADKVVSLNWLRNKNLPPEIIHVAFLPPSS